MAGSYQVPQFLDSGDKIIGPLNLRQFAYAFVGSFVAFAVFNIFASAGVVVGLIAASPIAAFIGFLAFGKYNGRDSEIYLFKLLENLRKQKSMTYGKKAQTPLLDQRLTKLNPATLNADLEKRYAEIVRSTQRQSEFRNLPIADKINRIRTVSTGVDEGAEREFGSLYDTEQANRKVDENYKLGETSIYNKLFSFGPKLGARKTPVPTEQIATVES
jgi:PrgI family protein